MDELIAAVLALLLGFAIAYFLLQRGAKAEARGLFAEWRATQQEKFRQDVLEGARLSLKEKIGSELAATLRQLTFAPADVRFLGHPITYVVFDGYAEVQARVEDDLRSVVFLDVADAQGPRPGRELVSDCIKDGRVEWRTVVLGDR